MSYKLPMKLHAKYFLILMTLFFIHPGQASPSHSGECQADPESKTYLSSLKASLSRGRIHEITQQFGMNRIENLIDTPLETHFFCKLACLDQQLKSQSVWILQSDRIENFANMNGFLCHQVSIENVHIVGSIYSPKPIAKNFFAYDSDFEDVHQWLQRIQFRLTEETIANRKIELQENLKIVSLSYLTSSSEQLKEAGVQLWEIAVNSEVGMQILKEKLNILNKQNWQLKVDYTSSEYFVLQSLRTHGRFLQYSQK